MKELIGSVGSAVLGVAIAYAILGVALGLGSLGLRMFYICITTP